MSSPAAKSRAISPLAPRDTPLLSFLKTCHERYGAETDGAPASYIPELAKVDPDLFGIAAATIDGAVYEVGDTAVPFTIQSVSKPFVFALALDSLGADVVEGTIGVEPSGEAFNSIRLRDDNRPFNAMVNSGAIACTSLIANAMGDDAFEAIRAMLGACAGRELSVDEAVYASERATGDRNRAIAYLLRNHGVIKGDIDRLLDVYFRQCAIEVTARDLAVIAATLANFGVNPLTGASVVSSYAVARTLAVMSTAGMYDFAGEWIYRVGVPAKSGVGGGIVAALPSQLGLGTFSPRLDARGNSVRGIHTCEALSEAFDLHMLSRRDDVRDVVVADYDFRTVPARTGRLSQDQKILDARSSSIRVLEIAGKLSFARMDYVTRRLRDPASLPDLIILNLHRVSTITDAGMRLLEEMVRDQIPSRCTTVIAGVDASSTAWPKIKALKDGPTRVRVFPSYDAAVEWAEDQVVYRHGGFTTPKAEADLGHQPLFVGLSAQELTHLANLGGKVTYTAGTRIIAASEPHAAAYFVISGTASARSLTGLRLSTLVPGMGFGELALIGQPPASDVYADTALTCFELTADQFKAFEESHPKAAGRIVHNLAQLLAGRVRMATARIDMLAG